MTDQDDFDGLMKTWQEAPSEPLPEISLAIEKKTRWIFLLTLADLVGTIIVAGFIAWLVITGPSEFDRYLIGFLTSVIILEWWVVLRIRRGTWRLEVQTPVAMLELLIRRCRASIMLAKFNLWGLTIGILVGVAFRVWVRPTIEMPDLGMDESTRSLARIAVVIGASLWVLVAEGYRRRKTRELERLLKMREELTD
jgi:hypothetical protein